MEEIRNKHSSRRVVIFAHQAPTVDDMGDPKFLDGPTNGAFTTELTELLADHTHWNWDFKRGAVRAVSNQRGYGHGSEGFDERKVPKKL
ncbi:hypothetical protein Clacol_003483 [Clathrus columnatus]|uniref:Uncharacterized protein n=1 Tax=Clathrus columnatus TaxID=1419009 RepID=A0AAV5A9P1_9AGAM|nr:hypothetical protein Clacol_003483 [Clathrus columnatus]